MYFCHVEKIAYGKINGRGFSNPHPSTKSNHYPMVVYVEAIYCNNVDYNVSWDGGSLCFALRFRCYVNIRISLHKLNINLIYAYLHEETSLARSCHQQIPN